MACRGEGKGGNRNTFLFSGPSLFVIALRKRGARLRNWEGDPGGLLSVCMRYVKASFLAL